MARISSREMPLDNCSAAFYILQLEHAGVSAAIDKTRSMALSCMPFFLILLKILTFVLSILSISKSR